MYRIIKNTHPYPHYQVQQLYKILWWEFWFTCCLYYKSSNNVDCKFNTLELAEKALKLIKKRDEGNKMTVVRNEK